MNEEAVRKFYKLLNHEEETEIRLLCPRKERRPIHKFVKNEEEFVKVCSDYDGDYLIYAGINERQEGGRKAEDVVSISTIWIDIDAVRAKGFEKQPATDEELSKAKEIKQRIVSSVLDMGGKPPVEVESGNGYQLCFPIPKLKINDSNRREIESKIQNFQDRVIRKYDENGAIDKIGDLPRIIKVTGTKNIKGNDSIERPHREARFLTDDWSNDGDENLWEMINNLSADDLLEGEEAKIIPREEFNPDFLPKCIDHIYNQFVFKNPSGWMRATETLASFFRGIGLSKEKVLDLMVDWANKQEYHEENEIKDVREIVNRIFRNEIFVGNCKKIREGGGGFPEMGLKELFKGTDLGNCCGHYKNPVVHYNAKSKGDGSNNIPDFLIIKYNKKTGEEISCSVDIDKVADYLIEKHEFVTWFGIKSDYSFNFDGRIFKKDTRGIVKKECEELLGSYCKRNIVDEVFEKVKRKTGIEKEEFEKDDLNFICFENGVWDIRNKELLPHDSKYLFKTFIPLRYDKEIKCPNWNKFIEETLYPSDIPVMQEWFGFLLYRDYFLKKAVICVGPQDTGKSVLLDTAIKFIGENNKAGLSLQKLTHGSDFNKLSLKDKMLNAFDDLSSKDLNDGGAFKVATGNGYISGEEKFGEYQQFRSYAKQMFATNKIPPVKDNDDLAYFGRWLVFKFDNTPEKKDPFLRDKLWSKEEMSGILNWALEGLYRLIENGEFSYSKTPEENKKLMELSGDPLIQFGEEVLEQSDGQISKDVMYEVYSKWANEFDKPLLSKEQLGRRLNCKVKYLVAKQGKKERFWDNVSLKPVWAEKFVQSKKVDGLDAFKKHICPESKEGISPKKECINMGDILFSKPSKVVSKTPEDFSDNLDWEDSE